MAIQTANRLAPVPAGSNGGPPAKQSLANFIDSIRGEVAKALPPAVAKVLTPDRLCRLVMTSCRINPKLGECDFKSLAGALMTAAQLGLEPNTPLGHCYLIPRRNGRTNTMEATFQLGYQGMVELSQRSGRIQTQYAFPVYANDEFDYWYGLESNLIHRPALGARGPFVAVYAVAKYKDGGSNFVVLTADEVENYRRRSLAKDNGPWVTDYEAMACKTAFRRLFRWLPKSTELAIAISADDSVPTWDAMTGEVRHAHQVQIEPEPTSAPTPIEFEPEPLEPESPVEPAPEPARKRAPAKPRTIVEAQAHPVAAQQNDAPFDEPAPQQPQPPAPKPNTHTPTVMASQAPSNPKAEIAKRIEGWIKAEIENFEAQGVPDLSNRENLVRALYQKFSAEGMLNGGSTLSHRQVFDMADLGQSWEFVQEALKLASRQLLNEAIGPPE